MKKNIVFSATLSSFCTKNIYFYKLYLKILRFFKAQYKVYITPNEFGSNYLMMMMMIILKSKQDDPWTGWVPI